MRGVPDPLTSVDENTPDLPAITYSYYITYDFFSHQKPVEQVMYPSSHHITSSRDMRAESKPVCLGWNLDFKQ